MHPTTTQVNHKTKYSEIPYTKYITDYSKNTLAHSHSYSRDNLDFNALKTSEAIRQSDREFSREPRHEGNHTRKYAEYRDSKNYRSFYIPSNAPDYKSEKQLQSFRANESGDQPRENSITQNHDCGVPKPEYVSKYSSDCKPKVKLTDSVMRRPYESRCQSCVSPLDESEKHYKSFVTPTVDIRSGAHTPKDQNFTIYNKIKQRELSDSATRNFEKLRNSLAHPIINSQLAHPELDKVDQLRMSQTKKPKKASQTLKKSYDILNKNKRSHSSLKQRRDQWKSFKNIANE